ncbi:uncharacterized protein LOC107480078 [Arachis duranensis]|uniref:Uncharacterized protein LOC107480078 n=1 Tax=Arachis duranensis TaxID=130453 RepID=A0A6P4CRT2_ARADU|nr:uncharacterized protein LOC107480078 [Arachis duranensis]
MPLVEFEYNNSYHILERVGPVAYRMALSPHLLNLHDVFHVSQLPKYTPDVIHVLEPESVQIREDWTLPVTLVRIDDTSIKKLREKEVSLVKVAWSRTGVEEHTWELESEMRADYPRLFSAWKSVGEALEALEVEFESVPGGTGVRQG